MLARVQGRRRKFQVVGHPHGNGNQVYLRVVDHLLVVVEGHPRSECPSRLFGGLLVGGANGGQFVFRQVINDN